MKSINKIFEKQLQRNTFLRQLVLNLSTKSLKNTCKEICIVERFYIQGCIQDLKCLKCLTNSCKQVAFAAGVQSQSLVQHLMQSKVIRKVIRVQSLFFSKYLCIKCLGESSQQPQLWQHFVFKVGFEEGLLLSKNVLSDASSKAVIQRSSLLKYGISIRRFSFKITVLNIFFWKFLGKHL